MTKGVSLLAIGSSGYGAWAVNFAVSLKFHSPDIPIQLICDEKVLVDTAHFHHLFSEITKIDKQDCEYEDGTFFPAKAKLNLYKYFAFDFTAYFDVDAVCIRDISGLFDLDGDLYTDVQGVHTIDKGNDFYHLKWARPENIWFHFGLKPKDQLPAVNSSFLLVRKTDKNKELFDTALDLLLTNPLPLRNYWFRWGKGEGRQADELYFNVACAKLGIIPNHLVAVYFRTIREAGEGIKLEVLERNHYAIGLFGEVRSLHMSVKEYYNRLMLQYWRKIIGTPFFTKCENLLQHKIVNVRT